MGGAPHLQDQAAFPHSGDVLLAADERYVMAGARQHGTVEASDGAGAHDRNPHQPAPRGWLSDRRGDPDASLIDDRVRG